MWAASDAWSADWCVQQGPVFNQTKQLAELRASRLSLLQLQQLEPVSRHVGQPAAYGTKHKVQVSHTHTRGSKGTEHQKLSQGGVSRNYGSVSSYVPGHADPGCLSGRGLSTNNNNSGPGLPVLHPCPGLPILPTCSPADDNLLLGPDQIDMLLALAVSNCTGSDMVGCCKVALQASHVGNIIRNYLVAVKYSLCDVMEKMIHVIRRNFLSISRSREFLSLPLEYILLFMEDSYLNVQNELDMFVTALLWIDYNKQERIPYSDPGDIARYVEPNLHLFTGQDGAEALVNLYKHHVLAQTEQVLPGYSSMIPPRRGMSGIPARALIVSGTPTTAAGAHTAATSSRPPVKAQRVSFAPDTVFPPGDASPNLQTPASTPSDGGTPASTPSDGGTPPVTPAGTAPVGGTPPVTPAGTAPVGGTPPVTPAGTAPVGGTPPVTPAGTAPVGQTPLVIPAGIPPVGATVEGTPVSVETPSAGAPAVTSAQVATVSTPAVPGAQVATVSTPAVPGAQVATVSTPAVPGAQVATVSTQTVPAEQVETVTSTPVVSGAEVATVSTPASKLNPLDNVTDKSNNSRRSGNPDGRWVCADPSLAAWQAASHHLMSSCGPAINTRYNYTCPSHAFSITTSPCQDYLQFAAVTDSESGSRGRSLPPFHVTDSGSGSRGRSLPPFHVTDSGSGCLGRTVSPYHVRKPTTTELISCRKSACGETDAFRKQPGALEHASEQCQQLTARAATHRHVYVISRGVSGPVASIAYQAVDSTAHLVK